TFAGRDGMKGIRRELPRSKVAGHRPGLVPDRGVEGSPCGWTHPLLEVEGLVRSECPEWLLGRDRPDEAGELACAGDDGLLVGFAASGHALPARVEALLAAPGVLEHGGVLAALPARELVADLRSPACLPGCFDDQPADVAVADLGDRPLSPFLAA